MSNHDEGTRLAIKLANSRQVLKENCYVANLLDIDETIMINSALDFAIKCMDFVEEKLLLSSTQSYDEVVEYFSQK